MKSKIRQLIAWTVPAVILIMALVYAFAPKPVLVDLGRVTRGSLVVTVNEEGRTRVKEVYVVSAPVPGKVLRIERHVGDSVKVGDVLATLEPGDPAFLDLRTHHEAESSVKAAESARALAEAEVARAEAELKFARTELKRAEALVSRGNIAERKYDLAVLDVERGEAVLASARAALGVKTFELETARAALIEPGANVSGGNNGPQCCVQVRAVVDGKILRVHQESESMIAAGTPLVEIGDPLDLEIVVDLLSTEAVRIREGAEVIIADWGGPELAGRVRRIEPYGFTKISALGIEEQRVNVIMDFSGTAEDRKALGHGFRVETRTVIWRESDVLKAPLSALFRDREDWAVFVSAAGLAEKRRVAVGHIGAGEVEILDGLKEGDVVVLHPSDRIEDGIGLEPRLEGWSEK